MPASPHRDQGQFDHAIGYYASLQSFLTYSFGWSRPEKALLWWYRNGKPIEDPRLHLIAMTWEHDGTLRGFLAWLLTRPVTDLALRTLSPWLLHLDERRIVLTPQEEIDFRRAIKSHPWNGGSDPFHLGAGDHISAPSSGPEARAAETTDYRVTNRLIGVDAMNRTATYVSETIAGWYAGLARVGTHLPQLTKDRSWHVDVYVKPIGFMGTYRRSRLTGLWFAGPHRYHSVGN